MLTRPPPLLPNPNRWQPKKLSQKHKTALTLYAQGMKLEEIHAVTGVSQVSLDLLVLSDLGRTYLQHLETLLDSRLRSLYGASVDAIQDQLQNGSGADKLKAAALQMKAIGKLGAGEEEKESAEDVIQRIMNMQINGDLHVHVNGAEAPEEK